MRRFLSVLTLTLIVASTQAGEPIVLKAVAENAGNGTYRFHVTVRHDDAGWDHYADKWDVLDLAGNVLAARVLLHPHETEQPFTRSLAGVRIPAGISRITIRAHDKVHGYGASTVTIDLP